MNYDKFEKIKKQVGAEDFIESVVYATTHPDLGIGLLVERVDRLGYRLGHFYENGKWDPLYREIAYKILKLLDSKFGCTERCIQRLLNIDIAHEIIPYLSSISPQEVEEYKKKEYDKAKQELKEFFSPLDAYFWKWKYGFDIEKAYRWHKVKEVYRIFLDFSHIPTIDKYITPEETDILLDRKFLDLRSDMLAWYYLDSEDRGPNVVINKLIENIDEQRRYFDYKKTTTSLMCLEDFERFYEKHLDVLYHYGQLKKALSLEENAESQARIQRICTALEDLHKVLEHISINIPMDSQTITLEIPELTDIASAKILDKKYETVKQLLDLERTYKLHKSDLINRLKELSSNVDISPEP